MECELPLLGWKVAYTIAGQFVGDWGWVGVTFLCFWIIESHWWSHGSDGAVIFAARRQKKYALVPVMHFFAQQESWNIDFGTTRI